VMRPVREVPAQDAGPWPGRFSGHNWTRFAPVAIFDAQRIDRYAFQVEGRGFESRSPLQVFSPKS